MAHFLHLRHFNNQEEIEASMKEFFILKNKIWYQHGFKELAEKWFQVVNMMASILNVVTWRIDKLWKYCKTFDTPWLL